MRNFTWDIILTGSRCFICSLGSQVSFFKQQKFIQNKNAVVKVWGILSSQNIPFILPHYAIILCILRIMVADPCNYDELMSPVLNIKDIVYLMCGFSLNEISLTRRSIFTSFTGNVFYNANRLEDRGWFNSKNNK